ncbi:MAG TPA: M28 family peptidase [Symbiobacteriaceae bacterium]|nr:M28 family peptidase [Symbiobacteriaceae bacterium]
MKSWRYLEGLSDLAHRGTGTAGEAAAAERIGTWLKKLGYAVEVQQFRTPRDTLYLGPSVVLAGFAAAAILGRRWPLLGVLLCVLLLIPMVGELLGSSRFDFDLVLPTYRSQNVVARPARTDGRKRRLIISAHYDTQRASMLFHPKVAPHLQLYFTTVYGLLALAPVLLIVRWAAPAVAWVPPVLVVLAVLLGINVLFLLFCRFTGGYINGANDNGTGTALALALAEQFASLPLPGVELWILLTGAEEVGTRGMKHFIANTDLGDTETFFINLDNIGGGTLHYLLGEGMLAFRPYGASLTGIAGKMAAEHAGKVRQKRNLLLPTDGLVPMLAGHEAISFLAFDEDGSLPNYHWYTDTIEKIDRDLLAFTEEFLDQYIRRVADLSARSETA